MLPIPGGWTGAIRKLTNDLSHGVKSIEPDIDNYQNKYIIQNLE